MSLAEKTHRDGHLGAFFAGRQSHAIPFTLQVGHQMQQVAVKLRCWTDSCWMNDSMNDKQSPRPSSLKVFMFLQDILGGVLPFRIVFDDRQT